MIRWQMVRILLAREARRLQKNPAALMLIGLLTAMAVLMATSKPPEPPSGPTPVVLVYDVVDEQPADWVEYLIKHSPDSPFIKIMPRSEVRSEGDRLMVPRGVSVVELIADRDNPKFDSVRIVARYAGKDATTLNHFWDWFWPTVVWYHSESMWLEPEIVPIASPAMRQLEALEQASVAELVRNEIIGTILILIVQFFACCHLLVSFTAQDRERGTLTALVLSPAQTSEILIAKFLFHFLLSVGGCAGIVAILQPGALTQPLLWITISVTSIGLMSVGTCIATVTKNQASAGLLALCYMLLGAVIFYMATKYSAFGLVKRLSFENYSFPMLYATLKAPVSIRQATALVPMTIIVLVWVATARQCFYRFGWR